MDIFLKTIGAVNDETRVSILRFIHSCDEVCVCDIESSFSMIQSRVSRHLKILKEAGFLRVERRGRWAYYSIPASLGTFHQHILQEIGSLAIVLPQLDASCKLET